jgi:A/G-specific adenine glycosylase
MEMGATVCTPRNPKCLPCPIRTACQAAARGQHHLFPRPMRATKVEAMTMAFGVFADEKGTYLVQRPLDGLWAGLWEPPSATGPRSDQELSRTVGELGKPVAEVIHQLSHRAIKARVYRLERLPVALRKTLTAWPNPLEAPLSGLAKKVLKAAMTQWAGVGVKSPRTGAKKTHRVRRAAR